MNYNEAMEFLKNSQVFGSILGLQRIRKLLELLGNPQNKLKYVHVAGTNGKGSTVTFISNILMQAGLKVGIFTSPFIERFSERIKINDYEISESEIADLIGAIKEKVLIMTAGGGEYPTEFEILTAMAFMFFLNHNCDIVVLEVGIGGTLDSTNIIETSGVSVITTISYDHLEVLGNTIGEIASHKAGIIKNNSDVVVYPQEKDALNVIESVSKEKNCKIHFVYQENIKLIKSDIDFQQFNYESYTDLKIFLLGKYQIMNAAVAIKTIEVLKNKGYSIEDAHIKSGLAHSKWPGRFEIINESPMVIIDGAHNLEGSSVFFENLNKLFSDKKITFIVGVLADKEYKKMLDPFVSIARKFITVTPDSPRALVAEKLAEHLSQYHKDVISVDKVDDAIKLALQLVSEDEIICVFGSLYFIGQARFYFKK